MSDQPLENSNPNNEKNLSFELEDLFKSVDFENTLSVKNFLESVIDRPYEIVSPAVLFILRSQVESKDRFFIRPDESLTYFVAIQVAEEAAFRLFCLQRGLNHKEYKRGGYFYLDPYSPKLELDEDTDIRPSSVLIPTYITIDSGPAPRTEQQNTWRKLQMQKNLISGKYTVWTNISDTSSPIFSTPMEVKSWLRNGTTTNSPKKLWEVLAYDSGAYDVSAKNAAWWLKKQIDRYKNWMGMEYRAAEYERALEELIGGKDGIPDEDKVLSEPEEVRGLPRYESSTNKPKLMWEVLANERGDYNVNAGNAETWLKAQIDMYKKWKGMEGRADRYEEALKELTNYK
jgi:hypothetical protein